MITADRSVSSRDSSQNQKPVLLSSAGCSLLRMSDETDSVEPIHTRRLTLESMTVPFMEALARNDLPAAEKEMNASVPADMSHDLNNFLVFRLRQLEKDPAAREWLGRVMVLTDANRGRRIIGSIGFHGPPDAEGRAEVGYRVEPEYRRQGYAREAIQALFDWAHRTHGVTRFVASIDPNNEPSLRLAEGFGYRKIGEQMDEIDGLEYVFETSWPRDR
jgi:ribosomal-protein-alanine N-acetyltransferase